MTMTAFSRTQLGIILLVGALLLVLYAWRGNFGLTYSAPPAVAPNPVFVEMVGEVARPGVYSFPPPLPCPKSGTGPVVRNLCLSPILSSPQGAALK